MPNTRNARLGALAVVLALVGAIVAVGVLFFSANENASAGGVNFAVGVDFDGDNINDCGTGVPSAEGDGAADPVPIEVSNTTCTTTVGATLDVNVYLIDNNGLAYGGATSHVVFSGVTSTGRGTTLWTCHTFDVTAFGATFENAASTIGISPPCNVGQTNLGLMNRFTFTCAASGTIALAHGTGETGLTEEDFTEHNDPGTDSLTIDCATATDTPTPTITATPTNTPDATNTPTPNPVPKMLFSAQGVTCGGVPDLTCSANLFAGAGKRGEFTLRVRADIEMDNLTYGGFETQIDLDSGLTYNPRSCTSEVIWNPGVGTPTCNKSVQGQSVRLGSRTGNVSASTPFPGTTFEGDLVQVAVHCNTPGLHTVILRSITDASNPGSFFVGTAGNPIAAKAGNSPNVDIITINCVAQPPEMSLGASGPGVVCENDASGKPEKCVVPMEPGATAVQTPFNLTVRGNVIPANATPSLNGYGGFNTNIFWGALRYPTPPKPSCLSEATWPDTFLCGQAPAAVTTNKQHTIRSGLFPPFPVSQHVGELLRVSLSCPPGAPGQYRVVLNGTGTTTAFINPLDTPVPVATEEMGFLDPVAPNPTAVPIVDALLINCQIIPTVTPTSTPTSTATPTVTPCAPNCPTATFTVTPTATATVTVPPTFTNTPAPPTNTNTPVPPTPTITSTPTPCCETVNEELFGPGKVTTDTENNGATATDRVETSVTITSITGGKVTIHERDITEADPPGFDFFGEQVDIAAPGALNASNPLTLIFTLDESIVPDGQTQNTVRVFRNGILVPNCTGAANTAVPDPCVTKRNLLVGPAAGDLQFTVLTTDASSWNFGAPTGGPTPTPTATGFLGDVNCNNGIDPIDAQLILQLITGLISAVPCPLNGDVDGDGDIDAVDALLILQLDAGIIDEFPD